MIEESGMKFGEFDDKDLFRIETSELYKALGEGIKTVEFILKRKNQQIIFLEAKTSCPNEQNKLESEEKARKFKEYFCDISDKFHDSLQIYLACLLNCYEDLSEIGSSLKETKNFGKKKLKFVLVIKNAKIEWLAGPQAILENKLKSLCKIWNAEVVVLNEMLAKQHHLAME